MEAVDSRKRNFDEMEEQQAVDEDYLQLFLTISRLLDRRLSC